MKREKEAFAKRLREAMRAAGYEPRPTVLERLFNTNYPGRSVTFQAVSRWLNGRSIPSQDKLQVLAQLLATEQQELRFGEPAVTSIREKKSRWDTAMTVEDREAVEELLRLPLEQRKIVREVIRAFAAKADRSKQ